MKAQAPRNARPAVVTPGKVFALQDVGAFIAADGKDKAAQMAADKAHGSATTAAAAMLAAIPKDAGNVAVIASLNACPELLAHIAKQCKARAMYQKKPGKDGKPVIAAGRWLANSGLKDALKSRGFSVGMTTEDGAPLFRLPDAGKGKGGKAKASNKAKAKAKASKPEATTADETAPAPAVPSLTPETAAAALAALTPGEAARLLLAAFAESGEALNFALAVSSQYESEHKPADVAAAA